VAIGIVDVTGGGRLKAKERVQIGQVCWIVADVNNPAEEQRKWDGSQRRRNAEQATGLVNSAKGGK
jgi:hypothetical protein